MNRTIKFRAISKVNQDSNDSFEFTLEEIMRGQVSIGYPEHWHFLQFTGLLDKNGSKEVYEGDIIDIYGNIKGNIYEMDKGETDLVIEGFGTATWTETEKAGLGRGLTYPKRDAPEVSVR